MRPNLATNAVGLLSLAAILCLGGCVTSEASRFEEQMSDTIEPGERANPNVAAVFGLDHARSVSVAVVSDRVSAESP